VAKILNLTRLALCAAWAAAMGWLLTDGRYQSFLAPNYWVLLAIGIAAMVAFLAALGLGRSSHTHGRGIAPWLAIAICTAPLAMLAANPEPAPDSYSLTARTSLERLWGARTAMASDGGFSSETFDPNTVYVPRLLGPAGGANAPAIRRLSDVFGLYPGNRGRRVEVDVTVARPDDLPEGFFVAFRFVITCCAADAVPEAVLVRCEPGATPAKDTWARIAGSLGQGVYKGIEIPVVVAESVTPIDRPRNPYEN